jgi:hypothetical protein
MTDITVALSRVNDRELLLNAGDEVTLNLTVYDKDGDETPTASVITNQALTAFGSPLLRTITIPVGSQFTVPDTYPQRMRYRLAADIDGVTTTLCRGYITTAGARGPLPWFGWDWWRY